MEKICNKKEAFKIVDGVLLEFLDKEFDGRVIIPTLVNYIGPGAFKNCKMSNVHIPVTVTGIGPSAFSTCTNLKEVALPDFIKTMGAEAFKNCTNLRKALLSNSLESIPDYAFLNCINLDTIQFSKHLKKIGRQAFKSTAFMDITFLENLEVVDDEAFSNSELGCITFTSNKTLSLGFNSFSNCANLNEVHFRGNATTLIGSGSFSGCTSLSHMDIPLNTSVIGDKAINVKRLQVLEIKNPSTSIWTTAFEDIHKSTCKIFVPNGLTNVDYDFFTKLKDHIFISEITLDNLLEQGRSFKEINSILRNKDGIENEH